MAEAGRGRLSAAERAVVVVSVILVTVFAVLAVVRLTGDAVPSGATAATPAATSSGPRADATAPAGEDLSDVDWDFASPSGNIACRIDPDRALCGIADLDYAAEIPAAETRACAGEVGHFLEVTAEGAALVCDTSGQELSLDTRGVPALGYGQRESADGFTCRSQETGMTCAHDDSGYSFVVRRAGYALS